MFVELTELDNDLVTQHRRVLSIAHITSLQLRESETLQETDVPTHCALAHSDYQDHLYIVGTVVEIMNAIALATYWHHFAIGQAQQDGAHASERSRS